MKMKDITHNKLTKKIKIKTYTQENLERKFTVNSTSKVYCRRVIHQKYYWKKKKKHTHKKIWSNEFEFVQLVKSLIVK